MSLRSLLLLPLLALLPLAGCGRAGAGSGAGSDAEPLRYSGSSTVGDSVLPQLVAGYEALSGERFGSVELPGSSEGFAAVMEGRASVAGMSRSLHSSEKAQLPYWTILGYDALAVFVHAQNPVRALSEAQLKALFTGQVARWSELGGEDAPVELVVQSGGAAHGTLSLFQEQVMEGAALGPVRLFTTARECVQYVASHPHAVTPASLAFAGEGTRALAVDGVAPDAGSVRSGAYPLGRPLLLVTRAAPTGKLRTFFDYALSGAGQAQVARHFVPRASNQ
ncbi:MULTISPECIES: substrate-binding domain-containing protein [Myxococcaceae]|uniref:substrate-binding domain-containing protein n=1 Tax=Myxococcaceae TaxID=31 RepID=UPI00188F8F7D|nr:MULTISPECIES: substrate-binding domain-containing protein [Myxococcaceae]MBF5045960.1 substrate-binding domain-containing protein [Simulacricoccus sp. 17bor-14]